MNEIFDYFKEIFNKKGYRLYMVGGTSRDYLLGNKINDYDFVSDASPEEILKFLNCDSTYKKYGSLKFDYKGQKIDFTTLREEGDYLDSRHPSFIKFIKDINIDYLRRDLTINAIYIDENYNVIDPSSYGVNDLNNKVLRFIGNPLVRIKEDPLRILRAERFSIEYGLRIDEKTQKILKDNIYLLNKISIGKVEEEKSKLRKVIERKL